MKGFLITCILLIHGLDWGSSFRFGEECWPCFCDDRDPSNITFQCDRSPIDQIRQRFFNASASLDIQQLDLTLVQNDSIPADVFGPHRFHQVTLQCPPYNKPFLIRDSDSEPVLKGVNPDAFRSSKNQAQKFEISTHCGGECHKSIHNEEYRCDLSQLDFKFLTGFDHLTELVISRSRKFYKSLETLPPLPKLTDLTIFASTFNNSANYPNLVNGLKNVHLNQNTLNNNTANQLLNWIYQSSGDTLETLVIDSSEIYWWNLEENNLGSIPNKISSYTKLKHLSIVKNDIPVITKGSLRFYVPVHYLNISDSKVESIEAGSFKGIFESAVVSVEKNKLKRFESSVFQSMLHQMRSSNGTLHIGENPFDCVSDPCHLAWIIRDEPGLLNRVRAGKCSNGTLFHQLSPEGFNHCPISTVKLDHSKSSEEDYWPCYTFNDDKGWNVDCENVPMSSVRKSFNRNNTINQLERVKLTLSLGDVIPVDVLGDKVFENLEIVCQDNLNDKKSPQNVLKVDSNAFRFKQIISVTVSNCDLSRVDFSFLTGFSNLTHLTIKSSSGLDQSFSTLPSLTSLSSLTFHSCRGLNITVFPTLTNGLVNLELRDSLDLNDKDLERILNWIVKSSVDTLRVLTVNQYDSPLFKIPELITSFTRLSSLDIITHYLHTIGAGALNFSYPVQDISFVGQSVEEIKTDAFKGDFSNAQFFLDTAALRGLTTFESSVFQPILEQMVLSSGTLYVKNSKFDCEKEDPCHLNWLIRDNRKLLKPLRGGTCSNGTHFYQLDPQGFDQKNCPSTVVKTIRNTLIKPTQKFFEQVRDVVLAPIALLAFINIG